MKVSSRFRHACDAYQSQERYVLPARWHDQDWEAQILVHQECRGRSHRIDLEGYEVYENPDAQVFLRKEVPRLVADDEIAIVREGLCKCAKDRRCMADVHERHIVVYYSERGDLYQKVLRVTLIDEDHRRFAAERWCFLGSIDDWIPLSSCDDLSKLVQYYGPHIGKDSFYELE
jgi:hypothetical protein